MRHWKMWSFIAAGWGLAVFICPGWLAGWLVAIGLPMAAYAVASQFIPEHGPKALGGWLFVLCIVMPLSAVFVFGYVPGADAWFQYNVMPAYESIRHLLTGRTISTVALWVMGAFIFPVVWPLATIWDNLLGTDADPFMHGTFWSYPIMLAVVAVSWAFWSTAISRSLHFVGWWDPFWRADSGRRWVLQAWVRLREWIERHLGRERAGKWADLVEVASLRFVKGDVFFGRPKLAVGGMLRPIGIAGKGHVVTIGSTGAGKKVAALVPNLCVHEGSVLCIDPNGKLATTTARRRGAGGNGVKGLGQAVHVLDPFGIVPGWQTASYNPFDDVRSVAEQNSQDGVRWAQRLAEALIAEDRMEAYWSSAARTLLTGLILYVLIRVKEYERWNLVTVRQLLQEGDVERHKQQVEAGKIDAGQSDPFDVLLDEMLACRDDPLFGQAIAGAAEATRQLPGKARESVFDLAKEETGWLDEPEFRKVISGPSNFCLANFKTQNLSVYVSLPSGRMEGPAGRWPRMFVMMFTHMMVSPGKAPDPPVLLAIDEFPSLGRIDGIEAVVPMLRSHGVRFWAVAQDISQLKVRYPDSWTGFLGSAEAVQFMGVFDPGTQDFIVNELGAGSTGGKRLDAVAIRRLLAPKRGNQIVWRGNGHRPLLLKTAHYYNYLPRWYYDADPQFHGKGASLVSGGAGAGVRSLK
jgi:type IV secretory pathway TraG/TraD family ATPase VirD4